MTGFPRAARLLVPTDFRRVFERRLASRGEYFMLHQRPADPADPLPATRARLGIVIPKKLLKTAVHRNLLKRLAREVFRRQAPQLPPADLIVRLARKIDPAAGPIDRRAITADLGALFDRFARRGRAATSPVPR